MALSLRTATKGTLASSATGSITLPTGTVVGDVVFVGFANAGTSGPTKPSGWTSVRATDSAGTGQSLTCFWAPFSAGLTLSFTNAASVAAWTCQTVTGNPNTGNALDPTAATSSSANNSTLPTGAPTTGSLAGDLELLFYAWTSSATITTVATGSTIDATQANSTSVSCATGHNNTTSLGATTATTAFSQTLSASNTRKTGVGVLVVQSNPKIVTPDVIALTLTELVPAVLTPKLAVPNTTALVLTKFVPTVKIPKLVTPNVSSLVLTTFAPGVSAPRLIVPGVTSLIVTRFAPTVTINNNTKVIPGVGSLVITSLTPAVNTPVLAIPGVTVLTLIEFVPAILTPILDVPNKATLNITGFAPTILVPRLAIPVTGNLRLATFSPTVQIASTGSSVLAIPGTINLALAENAPFIDIEPLIPVVPVIPPLLPFRPGIGASGTVDDGITFVRIFSNYDEERRKRLERLQEIAQLEEITVDLIDVEMPLSKEERRLLRSIKLRDNAHRILELV